MDTNKFPPWESLDAQISPPVLSFVRDKLGFRGAAPVQATTIPLLSRGKDVVVQALTGSGKTLAFLIPAAELLLTSRIQNLCRANRHSVVVMCMFPTRELANQVHTIARDMIQHLNRVTAAASSNNSGEQKKSKSKNKNNADASSSSSSSTAPVVYSEACFVGGHAVAKDVALFQDKGAHLLLGTPGRLNELLVTSKESVCFDLRNLEMLILDEADRLLECGFRPTLDSLLRRIPKQRRTALFSATQSRELADLARAGTRNPLLVTVKENPIQSNGGGGGGGSNNRLRVGVDDDEEPEPEAQGGDQTQVPSRLTNRYQVARYADKLDALVNYLRPVVSDSKILVYVITCASVEWLHSALQVLLGPNAPLFALHGQMSMDQRKKVHRAASAPGKAATVICSDVASRGLDLPNVRHVVQFDAPTDPRTFVHRIGRTARMGQSGDSLVLLSPLERDYIPFMELQNVSLVPHDPRRWGSGVVVGAEYASSDDDDDGDDMGRGGAAGDADDDDGDLDLITSEAAAQTAGLRIDKRRTIQSVLPDSRKLKASRGRSSSLAKRRQALKEKQRAIITSGDLCESPSVIALRRAAAAGNETLLLRAVRAFVSFIRAYKEHECRNIFRLHYIDITDLANGFALFFVPNCGEIRMMNTLHIPLQAEFAEFVSKLDTQRKESRAVRIQQQQENAAAMSAAAAAAENPPQESRGYQNQHGGGGGQDDDDGGYDDDNNNNTMGGSNSGTRQQHHHQNQSVHDLARIEKQRIRESKMSQTAKRRAWAAAELAELRREAHLIRKEKQGRLGSSRVDELIGADAIDNAHLSTRERRQRRRTRSQTE